MRDILLTAVHIVFVMGILFILYRFIQLGYYIADIWKSKQPQTQIIKTHAYQEVEKPRVTSKAEVEQLPLDILAPKLKNPPKSPGGFGSKVSDDV